MASADRPSAETLKDRLSGTVRNVEINPVWAPDDSALFIQENGQVMRIDTATGTSQHMLDVAAVAKAAGSETPRIERFSIAENGSFICLVEADGNYSTLSVNHSKVEKVEPAHDPFALTPLHASPSLISRYEDGETSVIFINNTDQPAQLFWADSAGVRQPYDTVQPGACLRRHTYPGHAWIAGDIGFIAERETRVAYMGATPQDLSTSNGQDESDGKLHPVFHDHNLFLRDRDTGKETPLTENGNADWKYCGPAIKSPDDRYLVVMRERAGEDRHIDLIQPAPLDQLQPRTVSVPYPKPGDRIDQAKPCLFDMQTLQQIPLDDTLFANPWNISNLHWSHDSKRLFFLYNERGHQVARLLAVEAESGKTSVVVEEKSNTFIDWTNKLQVRHLDQTDEAIWMSERSGWNHLYLVDRKTGEINPITTGNWVVRSIERVDEDKREILFRAGGVFQDMDPYYIQYGRISFDGSKLTWLTEGNGSHSVSFSPGGAYYVDTWSRVDQPPMHELRRSADGRRMKVLAKADATDLLAIHPHFPEPFVAKGRNGETDIYGVIYRPSDFDPERKYPVVESIYAGPQDFFVPKEFKVYHREQRLAEQGFIVVKIDGMGTNWRSKEFHDVCWKNLKDAGFPDRIAWMKAASAKYPYMDLSRVGIYGTSAGGQSAMRAAIDHADFYKAAAADSGCHDNRIDKMWWNEQWMGWPVDESYAANSNVEDAHKLGGKLLLTVGALDSNVDPSSTMQVVDELIKADKEFELMVFPSAGHGAGTREYGMRLRESFFIRHLQ